MRHRLIFKYLAAALEVYPLPRRSIYLILNLMLLRIEAELSQLLANRINQSLCISYSPQRTHCGLEMQLVSYVVYA